MAQMKYELAKALLRNLFKCAEEQPTDAADAFCVQWSDTLDLVFGSQTQSYREVLLGCALAHLIDSDINIRLPYIKQGEGSFNGRTLDENVINPFLQEMLIPCSKGPYLATFRRNVKLDETTTSGLRDKIGYQAMLHILSIIENTDDEGSNKDIVIALLKRFLILRDSSRVPLARLSKLSVEQYQALLLLLVQRQSGGLIPVLLSVAFFQTLSDYYTRSWDITWQGINVADSATGSEGDVVIKENGKTVLAVEITERPIGQNRVVSTFNTKIIHNEIEEYLFIFTHTAPDDSAKQAARTLFSQGYNINFANIVDLVVNHFMVQRPCARDIFTKNMLVLLDTTDIPSSIKIAWNESVQSMVNF